MAGTNAAGILLQVIYMTQVVLKHLAKLWDAFSKQKEKVNDAELAILLSEKVNQSIADVMLKWDE